MTAAVREMFYAQANGCESLGSPLTARVLRLLAASLASGHPVEDRILGWQGDLSRDGDAMALRVAGGLHRLVLAGRDAGLAAFYAKPDDWTDSAATAVLLEVLRRCPIDVMAALDNPPQTNEVRRSAVLIGVGHWLAARFGLPLVLSELGASAGLNLIWDTYRMAINGASFGPDGPMTLTPDWHGALPPAIVPQVTSRAGVDRCPLDPSADRQRILSYIWADQHDRVARTSAACDIASRHAPKVAQSDAAPWLESRLAVAHPGHLHLVFHTIAWQYFPPATATRAEAALVAAGRKATPDAPLAHFSMENDASDTGAPLTLRLWPGGDTIPMGRADFHGRWVDWRAPDPRTFASRT